MFNIHITTGEKCQGPARIVACVEDPAVIRQLLEYLSKRWQLAHKALDIPYREMFSGRHTRASELISTGVEVDLAAARLGHDVAVFLNTYATWRADYANKKPEDALTGTPYTGDGTH